METADFNAIREYAGEEIALDAIREANQAAQPEEPLGDSPGKFLRSLRDDLGWTQKEVANKLGISPQYLSDIEKDRRRISIDLAVDLERMGLGAASGWLHMDVDFRLCEYKRLIALIAEASKMSREAQS